MYLAALYRCGVDPKHFEVIVLLLPLPSMSAVAGKSIMEHNEILGMDAALKYINQTLVDKIGDITLQVLI